MSTDSPNKQQVIASYDDFFGEIVMEEFTPYDPMEGYSVYAIAKD